MNKIYLFDLDSTVTKGEILPTIAMEIGIEEEMRRLTEKCMEEDIPFETGFRKRMKMVEDIPVSTVKGTILKIPLNEKLVEFIQTNKENCFIVSGSVSVFIEELMKKINMEDHYFSSKAIVENDKIIEISKVIDKKDVVKELKERFGCTIIAVGDGSNDVEMVQEADIGIAYGGVRKIAPSLLKAADYDIYTEDDLCRLLNNL